MADLSQTAANVAVGAATTRTQVVQYGESVTQGQPLYLHTDSKYYRCDANDTAAKSRTAALSLTPGATDAYGLVAFPGSSVGQATVNLGATLTVGQVYCVSTNVGAIAPYGDLSTGHYVTIIGVAISTALLDFQVTITNTQKP